MSTPERRPMASVEPTGKRDRVIPVRFDEGTYQWLKASAEHLSEHVFMIVRREMAGQRVLRSRSVVGRIRRINRDARYCLRAMKSGAA